MQLFHCKIENLKFSKNTIIKQMMYKLYKSRLALTPLLYARKDEDLKNFTDPIILQNMPLYSKPKQLGVAIGSQYKFTPDLNKSRSCDVTLNSQT